MKNGTFDGPCLFIGGEKSDYIRYYLLLYMFSVHVMILIYLFRRSDHETIRHLFSVAQFEYISNAGHWVHSEKPTEFLAVLLSFLNDKNV